MTATFKCPSFQLEEYRKMDETGHLPEVILSDVSQKWRAFLDASKNARFEPPDDPVHLQEIYRVWAFSEFVSKSCFQDPEGFIRLLDSGDLRRRYRREEYQEIVRKMTSAVADEYSLGREIRRFRRREMVRIAWRDLAGLADLSETMSDLTAFADACIEETLMHLYRWQSALCGFPFSADGTQQNLVVIGLGKLGGMELNFSSDVDLIFAYPDSGRTAGARQTVLNEEFFVRLSRKLIKLMGTTADGMLFRVDTRLRPFGESGPIVMSFDNMLEYYERQGREWERYAWIKARIVAGDQAAGAKLLERLSPFIYRRYLDYGVFESLRDMKQMISREALRKGLKDNIKLGPGGIREVEFFSQIFQLLRGGVLPVLQEHRIHRVLKILADEHLVPQAVCRELESAYFFLRKTENHLQEFADRQTHTIPEDPSERLRLSLSLGYSDFESFFRRLSYHMERVHHHFDRLLRPKHSRKSEKSVPGGLNGLGDIWWPSMDEERSRQILSSMGFKEPEAVLRILARLRDDPTVRSLNKAGKMRLGKLIPLVLKGVGGAENPLRTLNRIFDLIRTIGGRTNYLALLLENPDALTQLVALTNASPWVVTFLTRHPVLLDELLDPRTLYVPPTRCTLETELLRKRSFFPGRDLEFQIEELCIFKQVNTLRVSAADVTGVVPLMRVSDHLSHIAETMLAQVLDIAWDHLVERHGEPICSLDGAPCDKGFAIIAYGKLGGLELGYDSDLDLVFLHSGDEGSTKHVGHPIDNAQFFARLGQRIVHILTARTAAGYLYETDMRLRPSGGSGPLVSHIIGFKEYQMENARTWEHQALVRARAICGDHRLMDYFGTIRREVLACHRDERTLKNDVRGMRERLRKELLDRRPGMFDLRQARGGMVDIEFLVQYLLLLHAHRHTELTRWTDNVRILGTLATTGVITDKTAHLLRNAYLIFRSALHKLSLQEKPAVVPEGKFREFRRLVSEVWDQYLGAGEGG
jgi:glutamate-ammonia-ligase adenylyltransferase